MLKAKPSLKNVELIGAGILSQSLCRYYKSLWIKCKKLWLSKVVELFWFSKVSCRRSLLDKSVKAITDIDNLKILFPGNPILEEIQVIHKYQWYIILYI